MADDKPSGDAPNFPPAQMPAIYADAVWNVTRGPGIVKMYLARSDVDLAGSTASKVNVFAQLVLPSISFVGTAVFMNRQVQAMVKAGEVTQAQVDEMDAAFAAQEAASAKPDQ